jgi:HEAT repeat protein
MSDLARSTSRATRESDVASLLKLMANAVKNLKTYQMNNPVLQKSVEVFYDALAAFTAENASLTLLVRENDLIFGHSVVYSCADKMDSVAFALYKDGVRLITFKEGLARRELWDFLTAIHEARDVDPYQADLVTILWEKDLANITYRAVDVYLESEDRQSIEELARKSEAPRPPPEPGSEVMPDPDFFANELGFAPGSPDTVRAKERPRASEEESRNIVREILEEDDKDILQRCSNVCLEVIRSTPRDDTFNRVVDFLGRICDWQVASGSFLSACSILSDLRALAGQDGLPQARKASIMETIAKRSERRRIRQIEDHLQSLSDSQVEEVFAYMALMSPTAVGPLCEMLAESELRKVRYLLCRAVSILARSDLPRLRAYLQDERWFFVRNIVMILGMIASRDAIPLLKKAVSHPEPRVRREVARSLGKIRHSSGLDLLKALLGDGNKMVRLAALAATRDIGDAGAQNMLEDQIRDKSFGKRQVDEKTEAMKMYGSLGADALPFLRDIAEGAIKNVDDKTRAGAVYGLATIKTPEAMAVLRDLLEKSSGPVRYAASEALGLWDTSMKVGGPREH